MTASTLEQLPVRVPGLALATAVRNYPRPVADAPQAGADDTAVLAKFEEIFAAADKCPCCGDPLPAAVFDYDKDDSR